MVEKPIENPQFDHRWVTFQHPEGKWQADFPERPLEMTFELPFQNTPPTGRIQLHSAPTPEGALIIAAFTGPTVSLHSLNAEELGHFFETVLFPCLFCYPAQEVRLALSKLQEDDSLVSFHLHYCHAHSRHLMEGQATIQSGTLYVCFYTAPEQQRQAATLRRFIDSLRFLP